MAQNLNTKTLTSGLTVVDQSMRNERQGVETLLRMNHVFEGSVMWIFRECAMCSEIGDYRGPIHPQAVHKPYQALPWCLTMSISTFDRGTPSLPS